MRKFLFSLVLFASVVAVSGAQFDPASMTDPLKWVDPIDQITNPFNPFNPIHDTEKKEIEAEEGSQVEESAQEPHGAKGDKSKAVAIVIAICAGAVVFWLGIVAVRV